MREYIDNILQEIDSEIDDFDFYDSDIIENSLTMIARLENTLNELRERMANYTFATISYYIHRTTLGRAKLSAVMREICSTKKLSPVERELSYIIFSA